jgi:hypothetical protein
LGIDCTLRPDLYSKILSVNFDDSPKLMVGGANDIKNDNLKNKGFSVEEDLLRPGNLSFTFDGNLLDYNFDSRKRCGRCPNGCSKHCHGNCHHTDFSFKDYLRESDLAPAMALQKRVNEVINSARAMEQKKIDKKKYVFQSYIEQLISSYIVAVTNMPNSKFNLMLGLRLNKYVEDRKPILEFQRNLNRYRQQMKTQGFANKDLSNKIQTGSSILIRQMMNYVNKQLEKSKRHI